MPLFKKRTYLDYASATPVLKQALDAVYKASSVFANPGGIHADSVHAKKLLEDSRAHIAAHLGCKAREIIFTSGLTEGNNIAIVGAARSLERARRTLSGTHWIVSSIEHSSVLECFAEIERLGGSVTHVEPDERGNISAEGIARALKKETVFVSVGWANNEIGIIQPLSQIARAIRAHEKKHRTRVLLHSDGGQGPLYISPQVHTLGVDLFTLGSGKLYGPRGIGLLYVGANTDLASPFLGGGQERGLRSGTEEVALAAGFATAFDLIEGERTKEVIRLKKIRDDFAHGISTLIPGAIINGNLKHALPHMLNISIPGDKSGEYLVLRLDHFGISISTRSTCREGEAASHVVAALGGPDWRAKNTLRFSLGRDTRKGDIVSALSALSRLVAQG
jgi:cysteine desulfurase